MATRRTLTLLPLIDIQFPEERFHITHILPEVVARLVHALFRHGANLTDHIWVSFVVGEPPVVDLGQLPDVGEDVAESGSDDVAAKAQNVSFLSPQVYMNARSSSPVLFHLGHLAPGPHLVLIILRQEHAGDTNAVLEPDEIPVAPIWPSLDRVNEATLLETQAL